jgi:hypothetical protein
MSAGQFGTMASLQNQARTETKDLRLEHMHTAKFTRYSESQLELFFASVMDTVKERAFGTIFKLNRIYTKNTIFVFTECPNNLSTYVSLVRPCRASPFMSAPALRIFPAFHIGLSFPRVITETIPHAGLKKALNMPMIKI